MSPTNSLRNGTLILYAKNVKRKENICRFCFDKDRKSKNQEMVDILPRIEFVGF